MATFPDLYWAGTEHSLELAQQALVAMNAAILAGFGDQNDEEEDCPYLLKVQGEVGVISIRGPLMNIDSPYARYFGITTYPDIRRALTSAAGDSAIKSILLDIESGGGAVSGVTDTANLISLINRSVKPVDAFTDGTMASAAYWLGVSARKKCAGSTALVGSVGVLRTFIDQSEALKMEGLKPYVLRSGKYKALLNPYEAPTKTALDQAQAQLDEVYAVFIAHVADHLGMTVTVADEKVGQGREFIGKAALEAGLVDSITTFDALMSDISAKLARESELTQFGGRHNQGTGMSRKALTEQEIAAMAAGAATAGQTGSADPAAGTADPTAATQTTATAAVSTTEPKADAGTQVTEIAKESDVVAFLRGELRATTGDLVSARTESAAAAAQVAELQKQVAALQTTQASLMRIAGQSLSHMKVALGGAAIDASGMSAEALLAEHAATSTTFSNTFRVGGVAAVSAAVAATPKVDLLRMQRIAATQPAKATR